MDQTVQIYDLFTLDFTPSDLKLAVLPFSGLAFMMLMAANGILKGRGMSKLSSRITLSLWFTVVVMFALILACSAELTIVTFVLTGIALVRGETMRRRLVVPNERRILPERLAIGLSCFMIGAFAVFPVVFSASVSWIVIQNGARYDRLATNMAERIILKSGEAPLTLEELKAGGYDMAYFAADNRQAYRDLWRAGSMDLGRLAWKWFGDAPVDYRSKEGQVWNLIRIRPAKIFKTEEYLSKLPLWCEYEDLKLVRSNYLLRSADSLETSPVTAALHELCPKDFAPGDAVLIDPSNPTSLF